MGRNPISGEGIISYFYMTIIVIAVAHTFVPASIYYKYHLCGMLLKFNMIYN